jgi:hypothetical protein
MIYALAPRDPVEPRLASMLRAWEASSYPQPYPSCIVSQLSLASSYNLFIAIPTYIIPSCKDQSLVGLLFDSIGLVRDAIPQLRPLQDTLLLGELTSSPALVRMLSRLRKRSFAYLRQIQASFNACAEDLQAYLYCCLALYQQGQIPIIHKDLLRILLIQQIESLNDPEADFNIFCEAPFCSPRFITFRINAHETLGLKSRLQYPRLSPDDIHGAKIEEIFEWDQSREL